MDTQVTQADYLGFMRLMTMKDTEKDHCGLLILMRIIETHETHETHRGFWELMRLRLLM